VLFVNLYKISGIIGNPGICSIPGTMCSVFLVRVSNVVASDSNIYHES
jgi:hypothetical protein